MGLLLLSSQYPETSGADTVSLSDSLKVDVARTLGDTETLSDNLFAGASWQGDDTISLGDAVVIQVDRVLGDTLAPVESLANIVDRVLGDTLGATGDLAITRTVAALEDIVGATETLGISIARTTADILGLSDALKKAVERSYGDTETLSDELTAVVPPIGGVTAYYQSIPPGFSRSYTA